MRNEAPLAVQVPGPERDNPGWVKVGVIAAVGFVIGIAWPRIVGVKLGPSAPGENAAAAASASGRSAGRGADAPPAKSGAGAIASAPAVSRGPANVTGTSATTNAALASPHVTVSRGVVLSCKTTGGETKKGKECGTLPGLDSVVGPQLRKLASCSAAEGQSGKLSFVATAEFPSNRLSWTVGRSSTVGNVDGITSCLKTHFSGVAAAGVAHEHARYTVAYPTTFAVAESTSTPPSTPAAAAVKPAAESDAPERESKREEGASPAPPAANAGEASVGWEVALVRDVPKTGQVVARLPRGTKVKVGPMKDGWYAIKYGDGLAADGFVYRGAIGR